MKKIVYVPVYIDGKEENLPKESGVYFAEKNDFEKGLMYFDPNGKGKLQEYDVLYWMEFARFWLKPTVTDEDIKNAADIYYKKAKYSDIDIALDVVQKPCVTVISSIRRGNGECYD